ncbi:MAG: PEP-CTERM sorting domain-containing protein [Phycisphaerae bacterium]|nr:PEP-CTERM sorting domain-containing protein [Phycisphaerae bacterium]
MSSLARKGCVVCSLFALCGFLGANRANAAPLLFTDSSGNLAASVEFDAVGTNLVVTLSNTSVYDVLVPSDVLTAVFFDVAEPALALTPVSAVVSADSSVLFGPTDPGNSVGGEWAYRAGLVGAPAGQVYGIGSAGFGLFGPSDLFPGNNLQGPASVNGLQYGITSFGDDPATGNTPVTGSNALVRNTVVFTLSGLPEGFDPSSRITGPVFQYGTSLSEPHMPEPATGLILAGGFVSVLRRRAARRIRGAK